MATNKNKINFWDRPIVVTLIGGVLLGLVTTAWQMQENRARLDLEYERTLIAERKSLLQEFSSKYETIGNIVNAWFTRVIWIAEEKNKPATPATRKNIDEWTKAAYALEAKYQESGSLDGLLARIGVSYRCSAVREASDKFILEWHSFQNAFQEFNRKWNDKQKLSSSDIQKAKADRIDILNRLEMKQKELVGKMGEELFRTRRSIDDCPA